MKAVHKGKWEIIKVSSKRWVATHPVIGKVKASSHKALSSLIKAIDKNLHYS